MDTTAVGANNMAIALAVITGLLGLLGALVSIFLTQRNNKELELLRFKLSGAAEEEKARRDYHYEARKRLYEQIEPLLFQLVEQGENAVARVYTLARTAQKGELEPRPGWISPLHDEYFLTSTLYKFLAPLVIVRIIQNKLTLVDLTVDPVVRKQYVLAKILLWSFTEDFDLAQVTDPPLPYDPRGDAFKIRHQDPAKYWKQGIATGRLDNLLAALTTTDIKGSPRCMTYGEFQDLFRERSRSDDEAFIRITDLFLDFHPKTRPVLWRILVAQAYVYRILIGISEAKISSPTANEDVLQRKLDDLARLDMKRFDWRQIPDEASDVEVLQTPFDAAQLYVDRRLRGEW